ncbi:hypothetical protein RB195_003463 [Necator americanus]|uniref:G-protein coupled receptors family 1 profile domain-containing protein n=1 Tax=Necator americanus TaxID=51031 RepID=A0ABR1DNP9_NECAM
MAESGRSDLQALVIVEEILPHTVMTVQATFAIRLLASSLILIPAVFGLVLQTLLGIALYKGWKTFRENSFYLITVQLMWCDICALLLDLYAAFPLILTGVEYMGDSIPLYYLPLAFEGIAFNGIFMLSLFLTVNRFLIFLFPAVHAKIFTTFGTKIMSAFVWIYVFTLIALSNFFGCRKEFSKEFFYFWYHCQISDEQSFDYKEFLYTHSYVIPCIMIIMYIAIYIRVKLYRRGLKVNSKTSLKQEMKYLVQTVLICILIAVEVAAFIFLPFLGIDGYGQFYVNMLLNLILIANNLMTPIVILSFNVDVRQQLKGAFFRQSRTASLLSTTFSLS